MTNSHCSHYCRKLDQEEVDAVVFTGGQAVPCAGLAAPGKLCIGARLSKAAGWLRAVFLLAAAHQLGCAVLTQGPASEPVEAAGANDGQTVLEGMADSAAGDGAGVAQGDVRESSGSPPVQAPAAQPEPGVSASETAAQAPLHKRLAYWPDSPTHILDLPPDFFAVQILTLQRKEALEAYALARGLRGAPAARIESDGRLLYVLLLGVYPSKRTAQQAAANLPLDLTGAKPWVRSLASLQAAIRRGDALAGGAEATDGLRDPL